MRELWRKTFELFRRRPVLWLPYVCALTITSCLTWLNNLGGRAIFRWLTTPQPNRYHSVLGGAFTSRGTDPGVVRKYEEMRSCLRWATHFVNISVDTTALVFTAILVMMILQAQPLGFAGAMAKLRGFPGKILRYSAKYWLLLLALTVVGMGAFGYAYSALLHYRSWVASVAFSGWDLLDELCVAWVMAPIALELLRPVGSSTTSDGLKRRARYAYVTTAVAVFVLRHLAGPLRGMVGSGSMAAQVVNLYLAPLMIECPYILLYIALTLLASDVPLAAGSESALHLPQAIKNLMPLHYPPTEK